MSGLQPPPRINVNTQDVAGTQDLSESDDHFSSASEGEAPPTPITRVERVDDRPAHGEVPGTHAYSLRTQDAVPDEIEIVPDGQRSRSGTQSRSRAASNLSASSRPETPRSPGGTPVPRTVVERVDDKPAHGEVEGTYAAEQRRADAEPDEVRRAPQEARSGVIDEEDDQTIDDSDTRQAWFRSMWEGKEQPPEADADVENDDDDEDFGDDFDEFNEGGGEDDDFGDFDEGGEATPVAEHPSTQLPATPLPDVLAGLPPLNLSNLSTPDTQESITPYLASIFPTSHPPPPHENLAPIDPTKTSPFLSDRSLSLWQQLISPPPMQPPNWTRSRIRRLFLVSLGVPVDLDEILPPSKQKRLVLPNINLTSSPRPSTALDRLKDPGNNLNSSSTSLDSKTGSKRPSSKRLPKGPPPPPDFDLNAAALLCGTTVEALRGMEDQELRAHVERLECLNGEASKVLEYWLVRRDEVVKEKEAFEGVIENLVGFVKGRRGR